MSDQHISRWMKKHRVTWWAIGLVTATASLATRSWAASSPQFQLPMAVMASGGQPVSSAQFHQTTSVIGESIGGSSTSAQFALRGGAAFQGVSVVLQNLLITVTGTMDDPAATVTVNGVPATVTEGAWRVAGIVLYPGPNTLAVVARDAAGNTATQQIVVYLDTVPSPHAHEAPLFFTVSGAVDDPSASVALNLIHHATVSVTRTAMIAGATWQVPEFPLYEGLNTVTATARDAAGNATTHRIQVFVDTAPPARPTVEQAPDLTTASSHTFTGTKQAGTSVWINGQEVVPRDTATTWTVTLPLVEGDNPFEIVTKDAAGNTSSAVAFIIVVDTLPPVIAIATPANGATTNFATVVIQGTVDDHLTTVAIPGLTVTRDGRAFTTTASLPEVQPYTLTITATSPNGYVSTHTLRVTRGTIPTLTSAIPADGAKGYWEQPVTLTMTATDAQDDALEYQLLRNGTPLSEWSAAPAQAWTPSQQDAGVHTFEFRVRDAYGGFASETHDVLILRPPVSPP